jgi:hypothetical protein
VRSLLVAASLAVLTALLPAAPSAAQGTQPPPGQRSIIAVRVGSTATDNLCLIATGLVVLRPWEPGDPFPSPPATPVPTAPSVAEPVIPTDSTPVEPVPPPPTFADSGTH